MIIAMPVDRERTKQNSYRGLSLSCRQSWQEAFAADTSLWPLAAWLVTCYRFSRQTPIQVTTYFEPGRDRRSCSNLVAPLVGSDRAIDVRGGLTKKWLADADADEPSNCAFFFVHSEEDRRSARKMVSDCNYALAILSSVDERECSLELLYNAELHDETSAARLFCCYRRWRPKCSGILSWKLTASPC